MPGLSLLVRAKNMNTAIGDPGRTGPLARYGAQRTRHHVDFFCDALEAGSVRLVGDFNDWDLGATPLHRMPDGRWMVSLELPHGHHEYLFVVDGTITLDPNASGTTRNDCNDPVSLIAVS